MKLPTNRRQFLYLCASALAWLGLPAWAQNNDAPRPRPPGGRGGGRRGDADSYVLPASLAEYAFLSLVLGRVTDRSVTVSALPQTTVEGYFEYGPAPGAYPHRTDLTTFPGGHVREQVLGGLAPDTQYYYRFHYRVPGAPEFKTRSECHFHTQRAPGSPFTFVIQGDSHPERPQMSHPELYARTLLGAAADRPDFHICMGDDFSLEPVREVNADSVGARYSLQRPFLGLVAQSAPVFLLNGNHEQASLFNYRQTDIRHDVAVLAQNARNYYYPTVAPDAFYRGDDQPLEGIGLLKDYYAWTWGDVLFVVLDNYWQTPVQVDTGFHDRGGGGGGGGRDPGRKNRDWWGLSLGDSQYHWFKQTLEQSHAKFKFVFAHHVLGSGRGGVDEAELYEWGGHNRNGDWEFTERRPGWELPIHQLMVKHGVTVFFQGHDHLYARQEKDGIIYQEVPMPADHGYFAYNEDRYGPGVKLPNAGHLRVNVSPESVKVDYVRSYLAADETSELQSGEIAHSYTIHAKERHA